MPDNAARATVATAVAAAVVAVSGSALAVVATRQLSHRDTSASLRQQALAAARQIAVDFAAYDYRHLKQDFDRVVAESTGSFKSEYSTQAAGVQDLIIRAQAVSTAEVASAGLVSAGPDAATALVAINRTVKNTNVPNGQTDSFGLQIVLRHVGSHWLASEVKPL